MLSDSQLEELYQLCFAVWFCKEICRTTNLERAMLAKWFIYS
jgi:hypothetical protein